MSLLDELTSKTDKDDTKKREKILTDEDLETAIQEFSKKPSADGFKNLIRIHESLKD